ALTLSESFDASKWFPVCCEIALRISDSRSSPLAQDAACLLLIPTQSPQFFPSYTAVVAVLEALTAFIVSGGDQRTVAKIADMERFRRDADIYWDEPGSN
ncbi:MAG: hypothetical protein ACE1Y4_03180, partial [Lysobacterales bacterium]